MSAIIGSLYVVVLFFVLTPGILLSIPSKTSKHVVALTHAVVFAVVFHFTYKPICNVSSKMKRNAEGMFGVSGLNNILNPK